MGRNLHMPQAGDAPSAAWARDLVAEVRAHRLMVLPPLALTRTPDGSTLRIIGNGARRPADAAAEPFDFTLAYTRDGDGLINGATLTFTDCQIKRGTCYKFSSDLTHAMPALSACYVAVRLHTVSGVMDIISGANKADVVDTAADDESPYDKTLLYRFARSSSNFWAMTSDYRRTPYGVLRE